MDREKIGKFISELRKKNKISQNKLADLIHVDRTLISKWENGKTIPDIIMLNDLANVFDVSIDELIYGEKNNSNNKKKIQDNFKEYLNDKSTKYNRLKKFSIFSCIFILSVLFIFLLYYFGATYDKTKVYLVEAESEKYNIDNGLLIVTASEGFLKIGNIDDSVEYISIKYKIDNTEGLLYEGKPNNVVVDFYGSGEFKKYINNIYLEINDEEIKLIFKEMYSNNINNSYTRNTIEPSFNDFKYYSLEDLTNEKINTNQ